MNAVLRDLATLRRTRAAHTASPAELSTLDRIADYIEALDATATRRIGLSRELEVELFGSVQPIQADRAEAVTARALQVIRDQKRAAQEREHLRALATQLDEVKTGKDLRALLDELRRYARDGAA